MSAVCGARHELFAPALRSQAVARTRLRERLDTTLDRGHRLTLVSAPAGFGKSTVLSDWVGHLAQRDSQTRAAWLSLDEGDNDLGRLLRHLVAALVGVGVAVKAAAVLDLLPGDPREAQQFLNEVVRLDLDTADVAALEGRTEGWIAGLQLAALSLRGIPTKREVTDFIEAHRFAVRGGRWAARWRRDAGRPGAPICSWSRWTANGSGFATTTCSQMFCTPGCSPRTPTWSHSCTRGQRLVRRARPRR